MNILLNADIEMKDRCQCLIYAMSNAAPIAYLRELFCSISYPFEYISYFLPVIREAFRLKNWDIIQVILENGWKNFLDQVVSHLTALEDLEIIHWLNRPELFKIREVDLTRAIEEKNLPVCEYILQQDLCSASFSAGWIKKALFFGSFEIHQLLCNYMAPHFLGMIENAQLMNDPRCLEIFIKSYDCPALRELLTTAHLYSRGNSKLPILQYLLNYADQKTFTENINAYLWNSVGDDGGSESIETITWLLDMGGNPFSTFAGNENAFISACENYESTEIIKLFLNSKFALSEPTFQYQDESNPLIRGALAAIKTHRLDNLKLLVLRPDFNLHCNNDLVFRSALKACDESNHLYSESLTDALNIVHFLIDMSANIRVDDDYALYVAAKLDSLALLSRLIAKGADPDSCNSRALKAANILGCAGFLVEVGADFTFENNHMLKKAVEVGGVTFFSFLLDCGAKLDNEVFALILKHGNLKIFKLYQEYQPELPPPDDLHNEINAAIRSGHYDLIRCLCDLGWIHNFKKSFEHSAIASGDIRMVDLVWPTHGRKIAFSKHPCEHADAGNEVESLLQIVEDNV